MRRLAALVLLTLLAALPAQAQTAARTVIPVAGVVLPNGVMRYTVPVSVGGAPAIPAMLDTGSVGLRLLPGALDASRYRPTGRSMRATFGSGVELEGGLARAELSIGDLAVGPAVIQVAKTANCMAGRDGCPASKAQGEFRINGRFAAILGIGLRPNPADNPLELTAGKAWILILPRPGDSQPGQLIVNPSAEDRAGFTLFSLEARTGPAGRGWVDTALPACLAWQGATPICGPTLLDSGTPSLAVHSADAAPVWRPGQDATLSFGLPAQALTMAFRFGEGPGARLRWLPPAPGRERLGLNTGLLPYHRFAVLYDAAAGTIGLKPRD
jgi:hypothetical protein